MKNIFLNLAKALFPINRSITGRGVRKTLKIIKKEYLSNLKIKEVKSGTKVFDWKVPPEWNIKDAYLKDEVGKKIIEFKNSNLHVVSYSTRINRYIKKKDLEKHLFSIPNKPNAIPYITSYYKPFWGFCIAHKDRKKIKGKKFFAHINSSFGINRVVFVGDSAHSIHPIAGQGWNLGMRDVDTLIKIIKKALIMKADIGSDLVWKKYHQMIYFDAFSLYQITDKLNSFFTFEGIVSNSIRKTGFNIIDNNKILNAMITNYAMGNKL